MGERKKPRHLPPPHHFRVSRRGPWIRITWNQIPYAQHYQIIILTKNKPLIFGEVEESKIFLSLDDGGYFYIQSFRKLKTGHRITSARVGFEFKSRRESMSQAGTLRKKTPNPSFIG